jgi:hypothetical protein
MLIRGTLIAFAIYAAITLWAPHTASAAPVTVAGVYEDSGKKPCDLGGACRVEFTALVEATIIERVSCNLDINSGSSSTVAQLIRVTLAQSGVDVQYLAPISLIESSPPFFIYQWLADTFWAFPAGSQPSVAVLIGTFPTGPIDFGVLSCTISGVHPSG